MAKSPKTIFVCNECGYESEKNDFSRKDGKCNESKDDDVLQDGVVVSFDELAKAAKIPVDKLPDEVFKDLDAERNQFDEEIFGGSVPKSYIPAVEKGLRDSMQKGILAGYPVTNIKATLYDGSYHDVDSSEMAFKMAASLAFKKGMEEAQPILLEPIMKLTITVPEEYMGDVMGDINKRRGKILGMEPDANGKQVIYAEAPQSETFKYAIDLRSMTQGRGYFEMELEKYNEVPQQLATKIIEAANS